MLSTSISISLSLSLSSLPFLLMLTLLNVKGESIKLFCVVSEFLFFFIFWEIETSLSGIDIWALLLYLSVVLMNPKFVLF